MKPYLLSLGAGLVVGIVYSMLGVKSPAPPVIALIGLLGILIGEQLLPIARHIIKGQPASAAVRSACAEPILGRLPGDRPPVRRA
jgi:XapX domain-containing protein